MWSDLHNNTTSMSNFSLYAWATPFHPPGSAVVFDDRHATHHTNPNTSSPGEDDVSISNSSFTNASGHSVLTIESSRGPIMETTASSNELMNGDHGTNNHLWSQFLLSDDAGEDSHNHQTEIHANLLDGVSPKSAMPEGLFEKTACDYLKKLDSSYWDNPMDKEYDDSNGSNFIEGSDHRLRSKLSDLLIGDWSITTPREPNHKMHLLSDYTTSGIIGCREYDRYSCKGHDAKPSMKNVEAPYNHRTDIGKYSINIGLHQKGDEVTSSCGSIRRLASLVSLSNQLISKPLLDVEVPNPTTSAPNIKPKQGLKINNSQVQVNGGRGHGSATGNEGRRRRSSFEDGTTSEKLRKKAKHECSSVSTSKMQVPKAKLGDRIATLQQIVSPFGKTDTASVLMEAIAYIKYLQEQVQLFISNPYLKTNPAREYPWGGGGGIGIERKLEAKADLKSRGLCLVPISWAPQVCRDNVGSDYWAMPYRGVFYR